MPGFATAFSNAATFSAYDSPQRKSSPLDKKKKGRLFGLFN